MASLGMEADAVEGFWRQGFKHCGGVDADSLEHRERRQRVGVLVAEVRGPEILIERRQCRAVFRDDAAEADGDYEFGIGNVADDLVDAPLAECRNAGRLFGSEGVEGLGKGYGAGAELMKGFGHAEL